MSPTWFARAYANGWQPPLIIATVIAAASLAAAICYWLTARRHGNAKPNASDAAQRFVLSDLLRFGTALLVLAGAMRAWYAVIFAFRSTFSIKYFQHAHGLDLATAGAMNSYVFLAAMFTTPAFGWLCDKIGRYAPMLASAHFSCPCRSRS